MKNRFPFGEAVFLFLFRFKNIREGFSRRRAGAGFHKGKLNVKHTRVFCPRITL